MSVRAKFRCRSVESSVFTTWVGDDGPCPRSEVDLRALDKSGNEAWSQGEPGGGINLTITVPEAAGAFVPGVEYWVDFTPVDTPAVQVGDVIDPVPEAGHEGPQYVTAVTEHPDGTALDVRPATPGEIAAAGASTLTTHDGTTITT